MRPWRDIQEVHLWSECSSYSIIIFAEKACIMTSYKAMSLGFQVPIWVLFDYKCPVQETKMFISYLLHFDLLVYHLSFSLIRLPLWSKIHGCLLSTKTYPWAKYQGLSTGHQLRLFHRPLTGTCTEAKYQGLSTVHTPRFVQRSPFKVWPQAIIQDLSNAHEPILVHS